MSNILSNACAGEWAWPKGLAVLQTERLRGGRAGFVRLIVPMEVHYDQGNSHGKSSLGNDWVFFGGYIESLVVHGEFVVV